MSVSRRDFFKITGAGTAAVSSIGLTTEAVAETKTTTTNKAVLDYPATLVAKVSDLKINKPVMFSYPDNRSPCQLIKMGHAIPGGVGPEQDIVAYSSLCPHMGCPVMYDGDSRSFKCGCHFSVFDPEMEGQQVCGQSTENMPRIELIYDTKKDAVYAAGVHGLIYGRLANII